MMKRTLLFSIAVWVLILTTGAGAAVSGDYEYTDNGDTTCTLTNYTGPGGDVTIPDTLASLTVTAIGSSAFRDCFTLTGVIIPDSVITIGGQAFRGCSNLTAITVGNAVTIIGDAAFYSCDSLTSIIIGNSVTNIGSSAFSSCDNLTDIIIPDSVTSIGDYAFRFCTSLTGIIIPDSVSSIGHQSFYYCTSLTAVTIGNGISTIEWGVFNSCSSLTDIVIPVSVISIEGEAFNGCSSLTSISIPESVTSIGYHAFRHCVSLLNISVDELNPAYCSLGGVLFNKDQTRLIQYPLAKAGAYAIPGSVTSIESSAFSRSTGLTAVTIGNGVTSIGGYAFDGCNGLLDISVDELNPAYCSLEGVLFNKDQTTLIQHPPAKAGSYAIPDCVTSILSYAFRECAELSGTLTIPDSVINIGLSAFDGCTSLTNIHISVSVTSIGDYAFYNCTSLLEITVDALNPVYSSLDGVLFNEDKTILLQYPGGKAGAYTIPDSVTGIDSYAFHNCVELTGIFVPNGIPIHVVTTPVSTRTFYGCSSLLEITVDALNPVYSSFDGVLFNKDQTELISYPQAKTGAYVIPYGVIDIGFGTFIDSSELTNITIPDSVTSIGDLSFSGCTSLGCIYFKGDSPILGMWRVFYNVNATVYYLPGASGWGATYGDLPTAVWPLSIADVDMDGDVNLWDFAVFAAAWQAVSGDATYNSLCDISDPVGVIDAADLEVFANEWLITPCP